MPVNAAYSGTFDPVTLGHLDIIERAAAMFPRLVVAVGHNVAKSPKFTIDERVALIQGAIGHLSNVQVKPFSGLIVNFAKQEDITVLVRGVRNVGDVDYERQMAVMNRDLYPALDTVFLAPSPAYEHLSSTLVRELASLGAPVEKLVPASVIPALMARFGRS